MRHPRANQKLVQSQIARQPNHYCNAPLFLLAIIIPSLVGPSLFLLSLCHHRSNMENVHLLVDLKLLFLTKYALLSVTRVGETTPRMSFEILVCYEQFIRILCIEFDCFKWRKLYKPIRAFPPTMSVL